MGQIARLSVSGWALKWVLKYVISASEKIIVTTRSENEENHVKIDILPKLNGKPEMCKHRSWRPVRANK